jgi:WD40 repeat protein
MHDYINLLDFYYDKNENKFYVIIANSHDIRAYEFYDLSNYKTFIEREASSHAHVIVHESENKVHLIDSDMKGFIHIWDFNTEECIKTIFVQTIINGICLWDDQHVICTGRDQKIKVVDLKEGRIVRVLSGHEKETLSVQKINLSKYGECLVSHGKDGILKVWAFLKSQ